MKTLRKHVEDLNKYWPEHLGAGKPWTIPRVLYFYSLKTVDFSEEGLSTEDAVILFSAFADIMQDEAPLRTAEMGKLSSDFSIGSIIYHISPDQRIQVSKLAGISVENISNAELSYAICELPRMQAAEIFRSVLGDIYHERNFIQGPYTQKIFGDIETFNIGLDHEPFGWDVSLKLFFNAFCPSLKVLVMPFEENGSQPVRTFFSTESRRDILTHFETSPDFAANSELSWDLYELFHTQKNLEKTGNNFGIANLKDLVRLGKACPHLSQICLNMDKIKNISGKKEIQNALQGVAVCCPNITSLSINVLPADLDREVLEDLAQRFPKLKELTVIFQSQAYEGILTFLARCPKLNKLNLQLSDNHNACIDLNTELLRICPLQPRLEHLRIGLEQVDEHIRKLTPRTLYDILKQLPHLFSFLLPKELYHSATTHTPDLWRLRELNKKMREDHYSSRDIYNIFKRLTEDSHRQILNTLCLNGLADDLPSAEKFLEDDIHLLKKCDRRPVFSIQGNIIEQQLKRTHFIVEGELIEDEKDPIE